MLHALFVKVLTMSITAALVVVFILPVRLLLQRSPKVFSYVLWSIVLYRLLCPAAFTTQISVLQLADQISSLQSADQRFVFELADILAGTQNPARQMYQMPAEWENDAAAGSAADNAAGKSLKASGKKAVQNPQALELKGPYDNLVSFGAAIWLAGITVMLGCSLVSALRLRRRLVGAVRLRDHIYLSDYIASPFVYGIIRPAIYLPSSLAKTEREYIILHEQIHIRRRDYLVKMLSFAALVIHWFNPFVWLAFYLAEKDMEMSCDEAVIKTAGKDIRAEYSSSLLRLASGRKIFGGTLAAFGEGDTGSRIKHVMRYKKPASAVLAASVIIVTITVISAGSNPGKQTSPEDASVSAAEAEKILQNYLVNANLWQPDYVLEFNEPGLNEPINEPAPGNTIKIGNDQAYQFSLKPRNGTETDAGSPIAVYAAACDGSKIYRYDPAGPEYAELTYKGAGERAYRYDSPETGYVELYRSTGTGGRNAWIKEAAGLDEDMHQMNCSYILSITEDTIVVDPAEYIELEDTGRMRELGLTEDDMPDGYYFNNPDTEPVTWKLDENTQYLFIDWGAEFTPGEPCDIFTKELSLFQKYIKTYDPKPGMPFFFQVEDGVVKMIVEMPFA